MGLKASNQPIVKRVPQTNIEPGGYPARVVNVVDLGVHTRDPYKGQAKPPAHFIRVTYELTDVFMLDEEGNELLDKPRWVAEEFPLLPMTADLAVSTKRYKTIDPDNVHDGDWSKLPGMGVTVTVVNNPGKGANAGKIYDNVGGTSVMRKRDLDKLEELKNTPYFFDLTEPSEEIWKKLPQWLQDKIKKNIHFQGSPLAVMLGDAAPAKQAERPAEAEAEPEVAAEGTDEDAPW